MAATAETAETRFDVVPYVAGVEATLASVLRDATRELSDPRVDDPRRALRLLDYLVEAIVGFAIGTIAGDVFRSVRTWFGDEAVGALERRLGSWPRACRDGAASDVAYLDDAAQRPLVDELASKLHVRFCRMSNDVRALVAAVHDERAHAMAASIFELLAKQENLASRLAAELRFGWSMYVAAISGRPFPSRDGRTARSQALWLAWERQLYGAPVLTRSEPEQAGFIMLVS